MTTIGGSSNPEKRGVETGLVHELPKGWRVTRLKHLLAAPLTYGANESAVDSDRNSPRYIRITDINDEGGLRDETFRSLPIELAKPYLLEDQDFLLARSGSVGRSFLYEAHMGPACFAGYLIRARMDPRQASARFMRHYLTSQSYWEYVQESSIQATIQNVSAEKYGNLPVATPPLEEQRSIAAFLDYETARIDELVREQERLATLLHERRSTLVIAAVSGQHSNAEMVDSRIPWLSKVARGWREVQIRRVAKLGTGHTPSRSRPDYWENCTIPWITTGEVSQLREDRIEYLCETREKISEVGLANSSAVLHPAGTVFLSRTASAGFSGIMGLPMATSQDYVTWTCGDRLNPQYLLLCLRAMRSDLLGRLAMGSTHKTIYMPEIEQLMIPLPPIDEQSRIVERAWSELSRIDTALDLLTQRSGLLRERRSALITAAVTGQIDVRNWQPPDAELVPEVA